MLRFFKKKSTVNGHEPRSIRDIKVDFSVIVKEI